MCQNLIYLGRQYNEAAERRSEKKNEIVALCSVEKEFQSEESFERKGKIIAFVISDSDDEGINHDWMSFRKVSFQFSLGNGSKFMFGVRPSHPYAPTHCSLA